jgi:Fe2+ transport system protein FeoA
MSTDEGFAPPKWLATKARQLTDLAPHAAAKVLRLDGEHQGVARLKALGVCAGRRVELVKAGDPMIVRVLGARVGLSAHLASIVYVEPV